LMAYINADKKQLEAGDESEITQTEENNEP
jgi:hypothetical protein